MSLFKRGGIWWYGFRYKGVRIRESSGFSSRSAAARAEPLRKAELGQGLVDDKHLAPSPRFEDFAWNDFAPWSENQHRQHPSTRERYLRSLKVLVRYFCGLPLDMVKSSEVEKFKLERSQERRKFAKDGRRVTPAGVNRDLAVLRILFNLAIRLGKVRTDPVSVVKLLSECTLRMRVVAPEEERRYLDAASQPLLDVAILMFETGMRPSEVFHLQRDDEDLAVGFVRIRQGKTTFAQRTIPLTTCARRVLKVRLQDSCGLWLFPKPSGGLGPLGSVRKAHVAALKRAGLEPYFRLYDLRHTAPTRMAMAGVDLPTLRELAGHANIQMTMRCIQPPSTSEQQFRSSRTSLTMPAYLPLAAYGPSSLHFGKVPNGAMGGVGPTCRIANRDRVRLLFGSC